VRRFIKGDEGAVGEMATRILGSPDLYWYRGPSASTNFITCHDGFTLWDLVSYNWKHNEANGENNNDGGNDNNSWNCGWEGESSDPAVNGLRIRQMKNALTILMASRGVPMILMGDEIGRTQQGNNNAYCQDNKLAWMDWRLVETNAGLLRFFQKAIAFRHSHPALRSSRFFEYRDTVGAGIPDISFHGLEPFAPDFSPWSRCLSFLVSGLHASEPDDDIYVAMNMYWDALPFRVPKPNSGTHWRVAINTSMPSPKDISDQSDAPVLDRDTIIVGPRSIMVLTADTQISKGEK
ncbi:MAG TPA: glycogen debranching enzyme, partial [Terriglobia bacterium]|nr:glycogen debranching enzyme [Terriglobia bacterium]